MKRAYRYRITHASGCLAEQATIDAHVIDWTYFGRVHTWTVFNFKTGKETGSMHGVYVDKGFKLDDGTYKTDAELATTSDCEAVAPESPSSGVRLGAPEDER